MPVSWAVSFASSFRLCILLFSTTPVTFTVCPTWSARFAWVLLTSHVLPSLATRLNSSELSPFCKHPVMVRVAALPFVSLVASCATTNTLHSPSIRNKNKPVTLILFPPEKRRCPCQPAVLMRAVRLGLVAERGGSTALPMEARNFVLGVKEGVVLKQCLYASNNFVAAVLGHGTAIAGMARFECESI